MTLWYLNLILHVNISLFPNFLQFLALLSNFQCLIDSLKLVNETNTLHSVIYEIYESLYESNYRNNYDIGIYQEENIIHKRIKQVGR